MQGVQPGTAQEIPEMLKWIILVLAIIAVVLTSAWGKLADMMRGRKKAVPAPKEEK